MFLYSTEQESQQIKRQHSTMIRPGKRQRMYIVLSQTGITATSDVSYILYEQGVDFQLTR